MQHQSGAPTQVTRAIRRYKQHIMLLWERRPGLTRWSVLNISTRSPSRWKSRTTHICSLCSTLWTVWRRTTSVMATQLKSQDLDSSRRLHSRHHSTVLPRLGATSKESIWNLHTHAVDSATKLLANNRVLKERPPPIADEQRLARRQWCTLCTQLRSGYCYLLQDYKYRVFGEPSGICTDCGASPQDVRHFDRLQQTPDSLVTRGSMAESGEITSSIKLPPQREPWLTWRRTWLWQTTTTGRTMWDHWIWLQASRKCMSLHHNRGYPWETDEGVGQCATCRNARWWSYVICVWAPRVCFWFRWCWPAVWWDLSHFYCWVCVLVVCL